MASQPGNSRDSFPRKARPTIYAIVETGGKQYKVTEGRSIKVESLGVNEGDTVELDRVLMIGDGASVTVGNPVIEGAKVVAKAEENGRGKKIIVFKYKQKVRYRRKNGHRQGFTSLKIEKILGAGEEPAKKTVRRKKKEETVEDGA